MGYFVKFVFDVYLISSTIELFVELETDRVLYLGASALVCNRVTPTENEKLRSIKVLLCMHIAVLYTTHELEFN